MSDSCLTCGGLIMEHGVSYGYAGPVCQCWEAPRIKVPNIKIRKRASEHNVNYNVRELITKCNKCKREIPDNHAYYKHPKHGIVCEFCPEFADGGIEVINNNGD